MPLFGPKKVCQLDFGYYWADHEAIYLDKSQFYDPAAMEQFRIGYYLGWLTLHQVSSLSLPYKRMLRGALRTVSTPGSATPKLEPPLLWRREEDRVMTLRTTWYQHGSGAIQPTVHHDLGPGAKRRGMNIEEAVVGALAKIWRNFTYEQWCRLLDREGGCVAIISDYEEMCQRPGVDLSGIRRDLATKRAELAEIRQELAAEAGEVEALKAALRNLLEDWQEHGFPHGVGGTLRVR